MLLAFQLVQFASANENLPSSDLSAIVQISAIIRIVSPVDNGSYGENVSLGISVELTEKSISNSTLIPYQDIALIYSLDNGEWKNTSFTGASETRSCLSIANRCYIFYSNSSYSATIQALPNGAHNVSVTIEQDSINKYGGVFHYKNSTANFCVIGGSDQKTQTNQPILAETEVAPSSELISLTIISAATIVSLIVVALGRRKIGY